MDTFTHNKSIQKIRESYRVSKEEKDRLLKMEAGGYRKMKITILTVGKIKEKFYRDAIAEYTKRLSKYCKLESWKWQTKKHRMPPARLWRRISARKKASAF